MRTEDIRPVPAGPNLEQYKKQAKDLTRAYREGAAEARELVNKFYPRRPPKDAVEAAKIRSGQVVELDTPLRKLALTDAQLIIARQHGFASWPKFAKHIQSLAVRTTLAAQFEAAVDAIVGGDIDTLRSLLRNNRALVRERSAREHRATLLHYVGANGVEGYRQKSPLNAVEVTEMLLEAGADVNAVAEIYDEDTTLELVATSTHPARAGVQIALMELLLRHGATVEGPIVFSCIANGQPAAAEFLARHGAPVNIASAAGLGWIDLVQDLLKTEHKQEELDSGFGWACLYGRTNVVEFLLQRGVNLRDGEGTGQPPLHQAAIGGHLHIVKLLLDRGAPLEAKNVYGGTVLCQATWCVKNEDRGIDYLPIVRTLVEAGAKVDAACYPTGDAPIDQLLRR
jgi:ankyrin repeat protein